MLMLHLSTKFQETSAHKHNIYNFKWQILFRQSQSNECFEHASHCSMGVKRFDPCPWQRDAVSRVTYIPFLHLFAQLIMKYWCAHIHCFTRILLTNQLLEFESFRFFEN